MIYFITLQVIGCFISQDIMGEAMTLLQQAAEILRTEADMAQLLEDKLANLSRELEFD
jgi:hypothetical protein